jgi:hypothetical protein
VTNAPGETAAFTMLCALWNAVLAQADQQRAVIVLAPGATCMALRSLVRYDAPLVLLTSNTFGSRVYAWRDTRAPVILYSLDKVGPLAVGAHNFDLVIAVDPRPNMHDLFVPTVTALLRPKGLAVVLTPA